MKTTVLAHLSGIHGCIKYFVYTVLLLASRQVSGQLPVRLLVYSQEFNPGIIPQLDIAPETGKAAPKKHSHIIQYIYFNGTLPSNPAFESMNKRAMVFHKEFTGGCRSCLNQDPRSIPARSGITKTKYATALHGRYRAGGQKTIPGP